MDADKVKEVLLFSISLVIAWILIWLGTKFLLLQSDSLNSTALFLFGLILAFSGVMVVGSAGLGNSGLVGSLLILIGFYLFGRAAGLIEFPWLARVLGLLSWVGAFIVVYVTFPRKSTPT